MSTAQRPAAPASARPLRILLCTRGGLYGALVLERLRSCGGIEICGVVRSERVLAARYGFVRGALALIRRCGMRYALYLFFATTLTDGLCALVARGAVPVRSSRTLRVHRTRDVNAGEGLAFVRECAPDLILSAFFDQPVHAAVLALPRYGGVNIHPSLLPQFKGVDPVVQAWLEDAATGVSVHRMVPELDSGELLGQRALDLPPDASVFHATALLFACGAQLFLENIARLERAAPMPPGGSYQSWPSRAELRALKARGRRLVAWADARLVDP